MLATPSTVIFSCSFNVTLNYRNWKSARAAARTLDITRNQPHKIVSTIRQNTRKISPILPPPRRRYPFQCGIFCGACYETARIFGVVRAVGDMFARFPLDGNYARAQRSRTRDTRWRVYIARRRQISYARVISTTRIMRFGC